MVFSSEVTELLRARLDGDGSHCGVIALPGALLPEGLAFERLVVVATGDVVHVAVVPHPRAVELATARARAAAATLEEDLPPGRSWCLVLDRGQRCATLAMNTGASSPVAGMWS